MTMDNNSAATLRRRWVVVFSSFLLVFLSLVTVTRNEDAISLLSFTIPFQTPREAKAIEELYSPQPGLQKRNPVILSNPKPVAPSQAVAEVSGELKPVNSQPDVKVTKPSAHFLAATQDAPRALSPQAQESPGTTMPLVPPSQSLVSRADADVKKLAKQNLEYRSKIAHLKQEVEILSKAGKKVDSKKGSLQPVLKHDQSEIKTLSGEVHRLKLINDGQYGILYRHLESVDAKLKSIQAVASRPEAKAVFEQLPALSPQHGQRQPFHDENRRRPDVENSHGKSHQGEPLDQQQDFNPERLLAGYNLAGGSHPGLDLEKARAQYLAQSADDGSEARGADRDLREERAHISDKLLHMTQQTPRAGDKEGSEEGGGGSREGWEPERRRNQKLRERQQQQWGEETEREDERRPEFTQTAGEGGGEEKREGVAGGSREQGRQRGDDRREDAREGGPRRGHDRGSWGNLNSRAAEGFHKAAEATRGAGPYASAMTGKVFDHFMSEQSNGAGEQQLSDDGHKERAREEEQREWHRARRRGDESGVWDDGPNR